MYRKGGIKMRIHIVNEEAHDIVNFSKDYVIVVEIPEEFRKKLSELPEGDHLIGHIISENNPKANALFDHGIKTVQEYLDSKRKDEA
jgi:hypothetical protein